MDFAHKILVAGTASGSGKTTFVSALILALRRRGFAVQACKVGPDFIDVSHHEVLSGRPSYNLDAWMGESVQGENGMLRVYSRLCQSVSVQGQSPVLLAEGAMGFYDGASGIGGLGSAAHVARVLSLPVILMLDVRGMGQSAAAIALGFLRAQADIHFAGIICNHVGSAQHKKILQEAFCVLLDDSDPPILGYMPRHKSQFLSSRHLGLRMGHECVYTQGVQEAMVQWIENNVDLDRFLYRCAQQHSHLPQKSVVSSPISASSAPSALSVEPVLLQPSISSASMLQTSTLTSSPVCKDRSVCHKAIIAIAHDAAFSFLYADMSSVLEELGAKCVFFSPLYDKTIPTVATSLYFPGGYPELYMEELAGNTSMLDAVRTFSSQGKRIYAECGGFMYLLQEMTYNKLTASMAGLLPYTAQVGEKRAALGYRHVYLVDDDDAESSIDSSIAIVCSVFAHAKGIIDEDVTVTEGRGHEFHYGFINEHITLPPLWHVLDRQGIPLSGREVCGVRHKNIWASWIHLYPEGARELLKQIFFP